MFNDETQICVSTSHMHQPRNRSNPLQSYIRGFGCPGLPSATGGRISSGRRFESLAGTAAKGRFATAPFGGPSGRMDDAGKQLADYSWPGLQRACTFEPSPPVADRPGCCFPFRSAPALSMASTVLPRLASLVAATALLGAGGKLRRQAKRWRNRPGVSMITDKPEWRKATAGRPAYCVQSAEATNPSAAPRPTRTTAPPDRFCSATGKARAQSKTIGSGRIYIHRFFKLIRRLLVVFRHFDSVIWGCPMPEPSHYPVLTHYLLPHDRCPRPRRLA